jgi:adenine-specific DNA methylase
MKIIQEFSDDPDILTPSGEIPIKRIEKLPLPYTGNKKKLAFHIHDAIIRHGIEFDSVLDAFSGSATMSFVFKYMGKRVLANDLLTCAYVNSVAFVENDHIKLTDEEKSFLINNTNDEKPHFVRDNYLGVQYREPGQTCRFNKFTAKEAEHLDNFRANIDQLCSREAQSIGLAANAAVVLRLPFGNLDASADLMVHRMRQAQEYGKDSEKHDRRIGIYYDAQMNLNFVKWFNKYVDNFTQGIAVEPPPGSEIKIKRATFLANLGQHVLRDCMVEGRLHHGQSLAEVGVRMNHQKNQLKGTWRTGGTTEMDFKTASGLPGQGMKWWTFADMKLPGRCLATNMDVTLLLKSGFCQVDCAYFDPPYGGQSSDYATMYRFLEEFIYGKPLEELPHIQLHGDKFVSKRNYEQHFTEMLDAARHIPIWLFSYNDNSWKNIDYIKSVIASFKRDVIVEVLDQEYRYLYRKKQGRDKRSTEYLIIAR